MAEQNINDMSVAAIAEAENGATIGGRRRCVKDTDAALSLCALGRLTCNDTSPHVERPSLKDTTAFRLNSMSMSINLPCNAIDKSSAVVTPIPRSPIGQNIVRLAPGCCAEHLAIPSQPTGAGEPHRYNTLTLLPKKQIRIGTKQQQVAAVANATSTASRKNIMKPKDPQRDTSISFEEMKCLMRVYGPIKALRNRASKDTGKAAKPESIRRKFYRWFPDFNERFVKTANGWFTPKVGHQEEIQYREMMRSMDQDSLVKKRNDKRYHYGIIGNKMEAIFY